jgi:DNA mismatch repair ATPase MutL
LTSAFDPRLIELLAAQYRSTEEALKELGARAWDAGATEASISLTEHLTSSPIVVADNGYGMNTSEIERAYLAVAYDVDGMADRSLRRTRAASTR